MSRVKWLIKKVGTIDFVSWKGLLWAALIAQVATVAITLCLCVTGHASATALLITSLFTVLVLVGRLLWTYDAGFWGKKPKDARTYSEAVRTKYLTLWAAAFVPERTVVVTLILLGYLLVDGFDSAVAKALIGLFATGGLLAAIVTSPHALFELKAKLDEAQDEEDEA